MSSDERPDSTGDEIQERLKSMSDEQLLDFKYRNSSRQFRRVIDAKIRRGMDKYTAIKIVLGLVKR